MLTSRGRFPIQFHLSAGQLSALLCAVPRAPRQARTRTPSCNLALVGGESAGRWMEDWQVAWSCYISRSCCIIGEAASTSQAFNLKGGSGACWDWSEIPWCLQSLHAFTKLLVSILIYPLWRDIAAPTYPGRHRDIKTKWWQWAPLIFVFIHGITVTGKHCWWCNNYTQTITML